MPTLIFGVIVSLLVVAALVISHKAVRIAIATVLLLVALFLVFIGLRGSSRGIWHEPPHKELLATMNDDYRKGWFDGLEAVRERVDNGIGLLAILYVGLGVVAIIPGRASKQRPRIENPGIEGPRE